MGKKRNFKKNSKNDRRPKRSKKLPNPNAKYTFQRPYSQSFTFKYPIIKYLIENPTGKAWEKLIKTCKYFYSKKILYPVECLRASEKQKWSNGKKIEANKILSNLWIYDSLHVRIYNISGNKLSSLIPKICKCDIQKLIIKSQRLTYAEFNILTVSGLIKHLDIFCTSIKYSNGTLVTVDKLLENLKNLEIFEMFCLANPSPFKSETVKKIVEILSNLKNMQIFVLRNLTESFDFASITNFLKENEKIDFNFVFGHITPLPEAYKQTLEEFVDEILANPPKKIPHLDFPDFDDDRGNTYRELHRGYRNREMFH